MFLHNRIHRYSFPCPVHGTYHSSIDPHNNPRLHRSICPFLIWHHFKNLQCTSPHSYKRQLLYHFSYRSHNCLSAGFLKGLCLPHSHLLSHFPIRLKKFHLLLNSRAHAHDKHCFSVLHNSSLHFQMLFWHLCSSYWCPQEHLCLRLQLPVLLFSFSPSFEFKIGCFFIWIELSFYSLQSFSQAFSQPRSPEIQQLDKTLTEIPFTALLYCNWRFKFTLFEANRSHLCNLVS